MLGSQIECACTLPFESAESETGCGSNIYMMAENKMPDTFYSVRANSTAGALTLRFPPQTSDDRRKRCCEGGGLCGEHRRSIGRRFSPHEIRRGLDCISKYTYPFAAVCCSLEHARAKTPARLRRERFSRHTLVGPVDSDNRKILRNANSCRFRRAFDRKGTDVRCEKFLA